MSSSARARIARVDAFRVEIPIVKPFHFATGNVGSVGATAAHVFVKVTDTEGRVGWGESRPSPGWSYETPETVLSTIERYLGPRLIGQPVHARWELHRRMREVIGQGPSTGQPIAKCGLDMALHDLCARAAGLTLRAFLGGADERDAVRLSYTLTARDVAAMRDDVAEGQAGGFGVFNYKLGVGSTQELAVAATIRDAAGPAAFVWADANQSVPPHAARRVADSLLAAGTDVLEQPLRADAAHLMAALHRSTALPLAMDESLVSPSDVLRAAAEQSVDYLVVKVARSAGLWPTLQQLAIAEAAGMGLLVSGLTESMLAKMAACQVVSVVGCDGPAGLNGSQFVDDAELFPEKGVCEAAGVVRLGTGLGIGIEPDENAVRRLATDVLTVTAA